MFFCINRINRINFKFMKKTIQLFSLFFLFTSCVNTVDSKTVTLEIDLVAEHSDSIHLFYTVDKSVNFTDSQSFWTKVTGNKKNQKIKINFPDSVKPKQIRFDFCRNIKQNEVILNKINFIYKNKSFSAKGKEIFLLFREDQTNTIIDKLNGSVKKKTPKQINEASLYPKGDKLYNKLCQLYNEK